MALEAPGDYARVVKSALGTDRWKGVLNGVYGGDVGAMTRDFLAHTQTALRSIRAGDELRMEPGKGVMFLSPTRLQVRPPEGTDAAHLVSTLDCGKGHTLGLAGALAGVEQRSAVVIPEQDTEAFSIDPKFWFKNEEAGMHNPILAGLVHHVTAEMTELYTRFDGNPLPVYRSLSDMERWLTRDASNEGGIPQSPVAIQGAYSLRLASGQTLELPAGKEEKWSVFGESLFHPRGTRGKNQIEMNLHEGAVTRGFMPEAALDPTCAVFLAKLALERVAAGNSMPQAWSFEQSPVNGGGNWASAVLSWWKGVTGELRAS